MKKILAIALAALLLVATPLALASCASEAYNIPIVCGETGMTNACGVATYGVDYYSLGVKAGDMAADILLNGANPAEMPVATDPNPTLSVNETVASEIGFTIPQAIKDRATSPDTTKVTREVSAVVTADADYTVGVLQLMQHIALDQSYEGFVDQLSVRMKAANKTVKVDYRNANNDASNNTLISQGFVANNVDLIYTIATSSSKAAQAATASMDDPIPVLFNAVTNPVGEGLVASMSAPGGNVTGVSDINPVEKQIELIGELLGKDDIKIGLLYTSAETNSQFQIGLAKAHCTELGYSYVEKGISDINDLRTAMIALANESVDAIYIPTDNVLANGVATVHSLNTAG